MQEKRCRNHSVEDAINRFAPDATPTYTDSGKIIFRNETTGIEYPIMCRQSEEQ